MAAAAVHLFTATGAVLALLMVHFAYHGEVETVLWLFLVAMVIDGTDGILARRFRVKEVLPGFDGALLDNIVDYLTYAFAPMVLLWANGYLPDGVSGGVVARHSRCSRPATSSAAPTRRPTTTSSWASRRTGTSWPSTSSSSSWDRRDDRDPARPERARLRAGQVRLPVPHRDALVHEHGAGHPSRASARSPPPPRRARGPVGLSLAYLAYYVGISLWLTFSPSSAHPAALGCRTAAPANS